MAGCEAVTDIEHVKPVTGATVKRPYHKSEVKAEIEKENPEDEEQRFTFIDWYLHILGSMPPAAYEYTKRVVADAFFAKKNFVDGLAKLGLKLICRFRDDAALYYLYNEPKTGKPGAPKNNAKGFASLEKCQARSTNKLRTHFNMSITSLNCLKVVARESEIPYSISNLKTLVHGNFL